MKRVLALWIFAVFFCSILMAFVPLAVAARSEVQSRQISVVQSRGLADLTGTSDPTLTVPFYYQIKKYYCGLASLEMVFDYYGPNISQYEIADVARAPDYYQYDIRRAAHFSDLSTSVGTDEPDYTCTGYTGRGVGYAAFEYSSPGTFWLNDLRSLIDAGYPIVVLTWFNATHLSSHYRVVVGYDSSTNEVIVHDPWNNATWGRDYGGPNVRFSYTTFQDLWDYSGYWGLFTHPWDVSLNVPASVAKGSTFSASASVTYPCPSPFSTSQYPASSAKATITLPTGFSLAPDETATKTLGTGNITAGSSASVSWQIVAGNTPGSYEISVSAEGRVSGNVAAHGTYSAYSYTDRIGGVGKESTSVTQPIQYRVTFDQTGLDTTATGTVVTVDDEAKTFNDLPFSKWVDSGSKVTYSYASDVSSSVAGKRFNRTGVTGPLSPITVTESVTVTGNYAPQYRLIVSSAHDSPNPSGTKWYDKGTDVTASVTSPAEHVGGTRYRCTGYAGTGSVPPSGTEVSVEFKITKPSNITWNWIAQYYLTVNTDPAGLDSPTGENWYDSGTTAHVSTAQYTSTVPEVSRYCFNSWTGASGTYADATVVMDSAKTATANYQFQYFLTVTSTHDSPTPSAWVDKDNNFTSSVTSPTEIVANDQQWICTGFRVDGGDLQAGTSYTFINVQAAHTITFSWKQQFWIQVDSAHDSPTASQWVDNNSDFTASITSPTEIVVDDHQWLSTGFSVDGGATQAGTSYTFTNIQAHHTVTFYWVQQFWLQVSTAISGSTVSGTGWYDSGVSAQISATTPYQPSPNNQYLFTEWRSTGMNTAPIANPSSATTTVTMNNYYTVQADWQEQWYITVTSAYDSPIPSQWVNEGGSLTANVTSPAGDEDAGTRYSCTGYKVDDGSLQSGTSYTFTDVQAPHKIEFQWMAQYRLVVSSAHGSPNPSGANWYDSGTQVSVTVTSPADDDGAGTRHKCTGWTGTGSVLPTGTTTSVTFTITAPSSITWNWIPQYRINFTESGPEEGRSITITVNGNTHSGTTPYTYSEWFSKDFSVTFSITDPIDSVASDKRYVLVSWKNSVGSVIASPQTISNPNTFTAYCQTQYYINVNSAHDTPTPSQWVNEGESLTVSVTSPANDDRAGTRYRCTGCKVDGGPLQTGSSYTFTNVQVARTITFEWTAQYRLTIDNGGHGITTPSSGNWYDSGTQVTITINSDTTSNTTNTRYLFLSWSGTGSISYIYSGSANPCQVQMNAPIAEVASWKTQYYLTVATDPSGLNPQPTLSPSGPWYDKNTQVTLTAQTVSAYYDFDQWKVDGTSRGAGVNPITVSMDATHTAIACYNEPSAMPSWTLWLIGGLVAISAVAAAAIVVLVRRKKRVV